MKCSSLTVQFFSIKYYCVRSAKWDKHQPNYMKKKVFVSLLTLDHRCKYTIYLLLLLLLFFIFFLIWLMVSSITYNIPLRFCLFYFRILCAIVLYLLFSLWCLFRFCANTFNTQTYLVAMRFFSIQFHHIHTFVQFDVITFRFLNVCHSC